MSSPVTNNSARVAAPRNNAANNAPAANAPANNAPAKKAALNTADAAKFSSADSFTLADLGRMVNELESQVKALEERVRSLTGREDKDGKGEPQTPAANGGVVLPPGVNLPAFPGSQTAATNNAPANNAPAANNAAPANNAPVANNAAPANNAPVTNNAAPANNAPANNVPAANNAAVTNAAPANNASVTATGSRSQIEEALKQLHALQDNVNKRVAEIEKLLRGATTTDGKGTTEKDSLERQQAGLQAVSHVLADAKLKNLTPQEEAVVQPAVKRVHEIAAAIAGGDSYNKYAAELFVLHHTLVDPAGAGNHKAVTAAAQLVGQINDQKTQLEERLKFIDKGLKDGTIKASDKAAYTQQKEAGQKLYKALIDEEKALEDAKLVRLTPEAEKKQLENITSLGNVHDQLVGGTLAPDAAEAVIFKIGQALKNPGATSESTSVKSGAEVLKQIATAQSGIQEKLRAIDTKIAGGASPDALAGERTRLLESAESLEELGAVVKSAKLEQTNPAARREVEAGLAKASEIAQGLAKGDSPSKFRAETFVLKQTFQEPVDSKMNPAVQSGAGALQLLGRAEAANLKKQEELAAKIAKGADPRTLDAESTKLHRQAEDLETIRHAIESANFGGLNDAQEAQGAKLIDEIRDIGMKVANGEDFTKHQARFQDLAKQLADLKNFGVAQAGPAEEPKKPGLEPGGVYQVKNGDYLTKIARERLGDVNRYKDIIELNKDKYPSLLKNPDLIYPGWTLVLPKQ